MEDEIPKVIGYLESHIDILNLGLLLLFISGLRIGELAALERNDISGNQIHVRRTEICYENDSGYKVYEVRDFPKTEAGIRDVIIPVQYDWIIKKIIRIMGFRKYLFERNGERIKTYIFRERLKTVCKQAGVMNKSPHKIRKTYGTMLIDNGASESLILKQMGHTDIRTTKSHYYRNRKDEDQLQGIINHVIHL